jgi:hypothetical protein
MIINGLRIPHPATFKRREAERPRVAEYAGARVRRTVIHRPAPLKGKYAMPVIAIAAAIGSIATGVAAFTAATGIIGTVLAGAMIVGGAATLIGVATGNKNLVKYGGILSAVGGLGTLGMNLLGGAEGAAGATAGLETAVDSTEAAAGQAVADMSGTAGASTAGVLDTPIAAPPAAATGINPGVGAATETALNPTVAGTPPAAPAAANSQGWMMDGAKPFEVKMPEIDAQGLLNQTPQVIGADTPKGFFNSVGQWVKENPELSKIGAQVGTGILGNLHTSPAQQSQIDLNNANTNLTRQEAARRAQRADWGRGISKPLSAYLNG